jgi:large repetitive protein
MTRRTRRGVAGSVLVVLGLVIGAVIVTALQAEGRERSKAETNDGGAWLLKRDAGYVGHVNREVGEITAAVSVSDPGSDFDVDQADGVIVVHDATKGTVTVVDDSVERVANPAGVAVGSDVQVHAVDGGALIVDDASMKAWKLDREQLLSVATTDDLDPIVTGSGRTLSAATADGHAVLVDEKAGQVVFVRPDGATAKSGTVEVTDPTASVTMLGTDEAVFSDTDGDVVVASPGHARPLGIDVLGADGQPSALALQQPGPAADDVVAATTDGKVVAVPLDSGDAATDIGQLGGAEPVAPIAYGGCVFAVSTKPATFTQWCADGADRNGATRWKEIQSVPLDGAGAELRLRLVNGWVWINDIDTGAAWVTSPQQRVDRVEDWGNILSQLTDDSQDDDTDQEGGEVVTEVNPDDPNAEIVQSDQIDQSGPNKPPIARDDHGETRVDRPIDVDVLANDTDPNGDVLVVTQLQPAGGDAQLVIAPDGRSVQVSPAAGFTGTVTFAYTITDGRDADAAANVTVDVRPSDGTANRPPDAHNDIASTRRGRPTTFDVLANDTDPDGDALVLDSIALKDPGSAAGLLVPDPSGQVVFTPDPNTTQERIELTYTVSDDFGATADATVIVSVRLEDANNEPDARNDAGVTVVDKPIRLDVLANDTDPDDDPLFVAQQPTLVRPADRTIGSLDLSLTPDGELFFDPDAPGTYVFNYSATDGEETDIAQIRIEVGAPTENRPPTAIRDDVVIAAGGSRLVHVLDNDGDPDGDVIGLVGFDVEPGNGLTVEEVAGVGYLVTVAPGAPARPTFRYQVSDGRSDPVSAVVVVAVTDAVIVDQPPVARADVVEVRAGGKVAVPVLANDYDPEGGALTVVAVTPFDGADVAPGLNGQTVDVRVAPTVVSSFTLSYTVADKAGNQSSAFLDVRIVPNDEVNRPPIARTDIARTRSGVPVIVTAVANDSDPDGDIIAVESIRTQPSGGTAAVSEGAVVYTPSDTFVGTDRLTYSLVDAGGEFAVGEVLIGVMPAAGANRAPEAFDDDVQAVAGSAPLVYDVLANDSDADGDTLNVTTVGTPSTGAAEVGDDGATVRFTPPAQLADATALDVAFTYAIDDGRGGTASATVSVHVVAASEALAPIAVDDMVGPLSPGQSVDVDVLRNDLDPDGDPTKLAVSSTDPALVVKEAGTFTVTAGTTSGRHVYTVTDPAGLSDTAEVDVLVVPNRAPAVTPLTAQTTADQPVELDLTAQATDPDGDTLYFACCDQPHGGSAATLANGAGQLRVQFTPDAGFSGPATFAYAVDDQQGHTVAGAVAIDVLAPSNRPPVATDTTLAVEAGTPTNIDLAALVTDPDAGDQLTFAISGPAEGAVTLSQSGATVQASAPIDAADRTDSFTYTATDSAGQTAGGTVALTVRPPAAPPPQARNDAATTNQGQAVTVNVLANDIDPLGRGLTVASVGASPAGTATTDGQQVTFTPNGDFFGAAAVTYTVRDGANSAARQSEAQVDVTVIGQPSAPGTPAAREGNATATINWSAPPSNGAPIDDYELRIDGGESRSVGTATAYTWNGLTNGTPVAFSVRAHNAAGWGPWSGSSPAVTPDIAPGRPAAPSVQFADGALLVSWSPPANEGSAITNYDVQIGGGSSAIQRIGPVTQYRWDGLQNGQQYTFQVRAVNGKGEGEFSSPSAPEHPLRQPDAPAPPTGQRGDKTITVSWGAPGNGGDPIIEYQVQILSTGATNTTTSTSIRWANLPNGQPQQFTVRARNRAGWGGPSGASAPVVPCGAPDAPGGVAAARGDGAATVSWQAPNDQGCAITGYTVTASGGRTVSVPAGQTSTTVPGLNNGTSYTFTVVARNDVGDGARSAASNAVVPAGLPCAPQITGATPDEKQVALTWNASCDNGSAITTYQLSVSGGAWTSVGTGTSYTRAGLADATTYTFQLRAVNDVGTGPGGNTVSAKTPGPPNQVGGLQVSGGDRTVLATWSAPNDNGKPIDHYEVGFQPGGGDPDVRATSKRFDGLQPGTEYTVRVRACNSVGCGEWSADKSATTNTEQSIRVSRGRSAVGQQGCGTSECAFFHITASGMAPNTDFQINCFGDDGSGMKQFDTGTSYVSSGPAGNVNQDASCYWGYPGRPVYATLNGIRSSTSTW